MKVLILLHGFLGKPKVMTLIQDKIELKIALKFDYIWNLSYYSSDYGLDLSKRFNLTSPIFDKNELDNSLVVYLYNQLMFNINEINAENKTISLYVIAHSMGGLVIRALIKFKCRFINKIYRLTDNSKFSQVFLLGTPNHGTFLSDKLLNIPMERIIDDFLILFGLVNKNLNKKDINFRNSQTAQMEFNSEFLIKLNKDETNETLNITTFAGQNNKFGVFPSIWEPFFFWRFRIIGNFPWISIFKIRNDGIVQSRTVSLKGINCKNYIIPEANHMDLINWKDSQSGIKVMKIIFKHLLI